MIEKYRKHKKHNHSIRQHTSVYRLLRFSFEWKKKRVTLGNFVIIDFYQLLQLINRQISSVIEYYRLINCIFDDQFRSICAVNYNVGAPLAQDTPYKL